MKTLRKLYIGFIYVFLYVPLLVLVVFSFNDTKSRLVWSGFTFKWYIHLFSDSEILKSLLNTLIVAVISSFLATLLGTMAAVGISTMKKWPKRLVMNSTNLPIINPEIVTGVSLMLLFVFSFRSIGFLGAGFLTLIVAHTTFCLPYIILSVLPKLRQLDPHIYEAARDLGASPVNAFLKVVLPQIMPGVITGTIMAFTLSVDDFVISYFTSGLVQTLPLTIYSMTRRIVSPEINALSTILFATVLVFLILINVRQQKEVKKSS